MRSPFSYAPVVFRIGIAARNQNGLKDLSCMLGPENCVVRGFDVSQVASALEGFHHLRDELGEVDFVYMIAGIGFPNPDLQWSLEEATLRVNYLGFAALATASAQILCKQGYGHLVAVTSVAAVRPSSDAPAMERRRHSGRATSKRCDTGFDANDCRST